MKSNKLQEITYNVDYTVKGRVQVKCLHILFDESLTSILSSVVEITFRFNA